MTECYINVDCVVVIVCTPFVTICLGQQWIQHPQQTDTAVSSAELRKIYYIRSSILYYDLMINYSRSRFWEVPQAALPARTALRTEAQQIARNNCFTDTGCVRPEGFFCFCMFSFRFFLSSSLTFKKLPLPSQSVAESLVRPLATITSRQSAQSCFKRLLPPGPRCAARWPH